MLPGPHIAMPSGAFNQTSLILGRSQEVGDLLHIIIGHSLQRRHPSVRERAEEMGDAQSEFHASEMEAEADCKDVRRFIRNMVKNIQRPET